MMRNLIFIGSFMAAVAFAVVRPQYLLVALSIAVALVIVWAWLAARATIGAPPGPYMSSEHGVVPGDGRPDGGWLCVAVQAPAMAVMEGMEVAMAEGLPRFDEQVRRFDEPLARLADNGLPLLLG